MTLSHARRSKKIRLREKINRYYVDKLDNTDVLLRVVWKEVGTSLQWFISWSPHYEIRQIRSQTGLVREEWI